MRLSNAEPGTLQNAPPLFIAANLMRYARRGAGFLLRRCQVRFGLVRDLSMVAQALCKSRRVSNAIFGRDTTSDGADSTFLVDRNGKIDRYEGIERVLSANRQRVEDVGLDLHRSIVMRSHNGRGLEASAGELLLQ
jgi:hypothetical protein